MEYTTMGRDTAELRLLLACVRVPSDPARDRQIREVLGDQIDWTQFAQKAVNYGLAAFAGHTLTRTAPGAVPGDILDALRFVVAQGRSDNHVLFAELSSVSETLRLEGIDIIPLRGPVLALQAYSDIGLRRTEGLDFLIREIDLPRAKSTLSALGYQRKKPDTASQNKEAAHVENDRLFGKVLDIALEFHTTLIPIRMALDIDYAGLWRRAQRINLCGREILTLAPEDNLIFLAIYGGKELWWSIKWACDFASFVGSHPQLDWNAIVKRARAQGCLRMVLLATSLARLHLGTATPASIVAAAQADTLIAEMMRRILERWRADKPIERSTNKVLFMDRLQLHDGFLRQARYAMRTIRGSGEHGTFSRPIRAAFENLRSRVSAWPSALAASGIPLNLIPSSAETKKNLGQFRTLRAGAIRALAANPHNLTGWRDLGDAEAGLKRYGRAIAYYESALLIEPDHSGLWRKRRAALKAIQSDAYFPSVAIDPQDADGWAVRAGRLAEAQRFGEAAEASNHALGADPSHLAAIRIGIHSRLQCCDWSSRADDKQRISEALKVGKVLFKTVDHRSICNSEEELRRAAQFLVRKSPPGQAVWNGARYTHSKIRLAYISSDFRTHAVASLIVGCFEHHDKTRFETTAISLHPGDGSPLRRRIETAFGRFLNADKMSDAEIVAMMRELEIDIAVDLNGYTGFMRDGILMRRPAPVQVNYLGYPGTTGAPSMDYIIADKLVIPEENRLFYSEQVAYMPNTYMPCDANRRISQRTPSRAQAGLPEAGFIFACLNHTYKISPEIFDVWMRLLRSVEGSVLWLRSTNAAALANLQREAKARGVAPERLLFAALAPQSEDHLARLRNADLFLDTVPYNAHTTASDALWAGLPVLTCMGNTFASRVAASLLHAVGMPELVTTSLSQYEDLARTIAQDPEKLAAIKAKLQHNRDTLPLFDTRGFTRDLESAYTVMWQRQQAGLRPETFSVGKQL